MAGTEFEPIAIVGRGCVLPGCFTPSGLWAAVRDGRNLLSPPPEGIWGLHPDDLARQPFERGGFIRGFEKRFQPERFDLGDIDPGELDPFVQWLLQAGQDAWMEAGGAARTRGQTAVIVANLAYPSRGLTEFASDIWMEGRSGQPALRRFNAGLPAMLLARSIGAEGTRFCLDAACASSLYALKLACDELQMGRAHQVVCAAVNGVDNLFLHQGFAALNALSPTGRSRPLVAGADGLVPSEGAAAVVLRRLRDVQPSDHVHGVIRAVGLSNDGRRKGLLAPDGDGQAEAMQRAYAASGIDPASGIALLECHATGTPVGDGVELRASDRIFGAGRTADLPVGSVKSNTGHLITVAGLASLLKLLGAFAHGQLPPTRLEGEPLALFDELSLVPQATLSPWPASSPLRAGLSTFGFGGNNAHLIVEAVEETDSARIYPVAAVDDPVVICGVGALAGPDRGVHAIVRRLMRARDQGLRACAELVCDPRAARTPPADLERAEAQQLAVLDVANEALAGPRPVDPERAGCVVAMNCAPDAARWMLRERLAARFDLAGDPAALEAAREATAPRGSAADVLGAMPNMPANRLNVAHDWRGLGFTVAAEQMSGAAALHMARTAIQRGELDMMVVAGAEFASDPVHQAAMSAVCPGAAPGGDGAAALVLKRRSRALSDGDPILMELGPVELAADGIAAAERCEQVVQMYGNCHAAGQLLDLAVTAMLASRGLVLAGPGIGPDIQPARPCAPAKIPAPDVVRGGAHLLWFAAESREDLATAVLTGQSGGQGPWRAALVHHDPARLARLRQDLLDSLDTGESPASEGIYLTDSPVGAPGETAFVFTGSASAYPQAGRGLFMAFPELGEMLAARSPHIHILAPLLARPRLTPFQDLCCGVLVSQAQALLLREWFGISPEAALGLSLGETNALIAFGAWRDAETLLEEIASGDMYERHLGTRFEVLRAAWGESCGPAWENWQVSAPLDRVRALMADEPHADITIIYSPEECLIGGHPDACRRIADALAPNLALPTGHDFLIHTRFMQPYAETWKRYHTRRTEPVDGVRFYSNGREGAYRPCRESAADALTRQACQTIDFPAMVERAYRDGVRTFIEIGPRDMLTRATGRILSGRPHLAVAMDRTERADILQLTHAMAALFTAGHDPAVDKLAARLEAINANAWRPRTAGAGQLRLPAHQPLPPRPAVPARKPAISEDIMADSVKAPLPAQALDHLPDAPPQPPRQIPERVSLPGSDGHFERPAPAAVRAPGAGAGAGDGETGRPAPGADRPPRAGRPSRPKTHLRPPPAPLMRRSPTGPAFARDALEAAARGPVSELFGPLFEPQDGYRRQVRLPAPPLLLVDRISGIDAAPAREGRGTIWTETEVREGDWHLHHGRMRPGPLIEAGQADLSLISYMGADLRNRDERVYRLLGCEFTFQEGPLPQPGDRLAYQIEITGHAMSGDVRLFFFQYDCHIGDRLLLSVRSGQAGFFTDAELARSKGVLWRPDLAPPPTGQPAAFSPAAVTGKRAFTAADIDALRAGNGLSCFGPGFEACAPQSRPAGLPGDRLALIDDVPLFDPDGGPWGRGYLRARQSVARTAWFYDGHFHNDPCMPGTLMVEAALQALEIFAMAVGLTVERDSFVFEPAEGLTAKFDCRGQVVPDRDHEIIYEVFVDEIRDGDTPMISAALLASCDGLKVFHCERISLSLKRAWPAVARAAPPRLIGPDRQARGDLASLLACADGAPSEAFGEMYAPFDAESRVPRLPQPPFHFMTEVLDVSTPAGEPARGASAQVRHDLSRSAWAFEEGGTGALPFAALSEILLQPCGWLASHCGFATGGGAYFRNLDGDLTLHQAVSPDLADILVTSRLEQFSKAGPVTIVRFRVEAHTPDGGALADLDTSFGFFNKEAFARQAGVPLQPPFEALLAARPMPLAGSMRGAGQPVDRLRMVDRMDWFDPEAGLSLARGSQAVDPYAWYFRAHFFQDPVQPGSLGIGALLELLAMAAQERCAGDGTETRLVAAPVPGKALRWRCRGQVTPGSKRVATMIDIRASQRTGEAHRFTANGVLACDGMALYAAEGLSVELKTV